MSFGFDEIKSDCIKKNASREVVVETVIPDSESGGAKKVLSVSADARVVGVDQEADSVRVYGRVNYKLVYLSAEDEVKGLDYFSDFSETIKTEGMQDRNFASIAVVDTDTGLNGGIKLSAALEISLFGIYDFNTNCLTGAEENYYVEKETVKLQKFVCDINASAVIEDEYDVKADVQKVLLFDAACYISDFNAGLGNVLVSGGVYANVTYMSDGEVYTAPIKTAFSEELVNPEIGIGQYITGECCIKNSKVVVTGVEGSNVIHIEVEMEIKLKVFADEEQAIVTGLFSVEKEIDEKKESFSCVKFEGVGFYTDKLSGTVMLEPEMAPIRKVIGAISPRNTVTQAYVEAGKLIAEGVVSARVFYIEDDGLNSVNVEIPYSLELGDCDLKDAQVFAKGIITDMSARMKRDKEIELFADLAFFVIKFVPVEFNYISSVEEVGDKEESKATVSVYLAEDGETMWNAARALSARPDVLRAQNPDVVEPFKNGDRIIFYRQINFEF